MKHYTEDLLGRATLAIAREAIARALELEHAAAVARMPELDQPAATFVTLKCNGDLRGCIGSVEARRALGDDVTHNARAAAYRDPRFHPVTPGELPRLDVEVSVLSPRVPLEAMSEAEALRKLRPGIDGICFEFHDLASTFLPQVWESLPEPAIFLAELRRKAGLAPNFWHPDVRLSRYTVEKYQ